MHSLTIGDIKRHAKRVIVDCTACSTIDYLMPSETYLRDEIKLSEMERFYPCPSCGHCNGESGEKLRVYGEE
jgi:hypothetical protein